VGGVFTPTLFVGAAVGALFGEGLHFMFPSTVPLSSAYGIVGMGGFLAATTHAPLTSILMMFEMTLNYQVVLPLMLACVTSHYTAKVYRRGESIYHDALMPDPAEPATADDEWRLLTVSELIKPCTAVVSRGTTVEQVLNGLPKKPVQAVYVINDDKELVASVNPHVLLEGIKTGQIAPSMDIESATSPVTSSLRSDMPLGVALDAFLRAHARVLPVTSGQWQAILIGEVSRHDLLLAVQDRMSKRAR
jgi:CIC family chloride channel protein